MSFILDALKKSESERQRQATPGLLESSFAPARASTPRWVIALLALFAANLAVVGAILLHRPAPTRPEEPAAGPAATAPTLPRSSGTRSLAPPAPSAPTTVGSTETGPPNPLATEVSPVLAPEVPVDQSENPIVQAARRHAAAAPPAAPRAG
ncbi:MAG: hypothetical protein KGL34_07430, partial [Gammaproteobacteria bacterium]|nr:hypothetical protein [Gammaproteobacteria bacterium]